MTVSTTNVSVSYAGDDSTVAFPITFQFGTSADLSVALVNDDTDAETAQTLTTHYTVSQSAGGTGTLTMLTAPAVGTTLRIRRITAKTQPDSLRNRGSYYPETVEAMFDRNVRQIQEVKEAADRSLHLPFGSSVSGELPPLVAGAVPMVNDGEDGFSWALWGTNPEALASLALGSGSRLIGFKSDDPDAVEQTLHDLGMEAVTPFRFGAKFDGTTDDTTAIQKALNTGKTVVFPAMSNPAIAGNLSPKNGQVLRFMGGPFLQSLQGNGSDPVILVGDGTGAVRKISIIGGYIVSENAPALYANIAPNLSLENCNFSTTDDDAVRLMQSYRAYIKNCKANCVGPYWAINAYDNMNGLRMDANTLTGGSQGGALRIVQSQGINVQSSIIESSLHGIWIGSDSGIGQGNCNGVYLGANYIEQCSTPFNIGLVNQVAGLVAEANYIGNTNSSNISARTACFNIGRLLASRISNNELRVSSAGNEDLFWLTLNATGTPISKVRIFDNDVFGTPANVYQLKGTEAATTSILRNIGGNNYFDFMAGGNGAKKQVFVSKPLTANEAATNLAWLSDGQASIGGVVESVEIIEASATGASIDCSVKLGHATTSTAEVVSTVNLSTLTFVNGRAALTVASGIVRTGEAAVYSVVAGTGTATFRIRITYRVN